MVKCCCQDRKLKDIICCLQKEISVLRNSSEAYNLNGCIYCGDEEHDIVFDNTYTEPPSVVVSIVRANPELSSTSSISQNIIAHKHSLSEDSVTLITKNCSMIQPYKALGSLPSLVQINGTDLSIACHDSVQNFITYYSSDNRGNTFKKSVVYNLDSDFIISLVNSNTAVGFILIVFIHNIPGVGYVTSTAHSEDGTQWTINDISFYDSATYISGKLSVFLEGPGGAAPSSITYQVLNTTTNILDYRYFHNVLEEGTTFDISIFTLSGLTDLILSSNCVVYKSTSGSFFPSFCYQDGSDINFIVATSADGSSWGAPITVNAVTSLETDPSLAIINDIPAIAYIDNNILYYVRADNQNGTSWGLRQPLDMSFEGAPFPDTVYLIVLNGNPAITYSKSGATYIITALDVLGNTWDAEPVKIIDRVDSNHTSNNAGTVVLTNQMSDQVAIVTGGKNSKSSRLNISDDSVTYSVQVHAVTNV